MIGGGIAGLAAAWEFNGHDPDAEVVVFEPDRLGGKIHTEDFAGHPVDCGPDAFLTRVPDAVRLCVELGLDAELVAPAAGRALLWRGGSLAALPDGLVLGVPGRLRPLLTSGLLSVTGLLRAGADLVRPRRRWPDDASVAEVIGYRFGRQVVDRLVDPLIGGIHAGSTDRLSIDAVAPQLAQAARTHRSLLLGLRSGPPAPAGPVFLAPRGGMARLADRLVDRLRDRGVRFETASVAGLERASTGTWELDPGGRFDVVVVATPAATTARLIGSVAPDASAELGRIRTASVVLVTLAYPSTAFTVPAGASGILVPRAEGRLMTACSFGSAKWPHWSSPGIAILRVSAGRDGDRRAFDLGDEALVDRLHSEVETAVGATGSPTEWRVSRWPDSFPQYDVGHLGRVQRIEQSLTRQHPTLAVAGAGYRGSGLPACIASGRTAAASVLAAAAIPAPS